MDQPHTRYWVSSSQKRAFVSGEPLALSTNGNSKQSQPGRALGTGSRGAVIYELVAKRDDDAHERFARDAPADMEIPSESLVGLYHALNAPPFERRLECPALSHEKAQGFACGSAEVDPATTRQ